MSYTNETWFIEEHTSGDIAICTHDRLIARLPSNAFGDADFIVASHEMLGLLEQLQIELRSNAWESEQDGWLSEIDRVIAKARGLA